MKRIENNCVRCDRCHHCGARHQDVWVCDECGDYADTWHPLYQYEGKELCADCLRSKLVHKCCDDMDDTRCTECGDEAEDMYQYDGEWYCEDCVVKLFDKVRMD